MYCWQVVSRWDDSCYTVGPVWAFQTVCIDETPGGPVVTSALQQDYPSTTTSGTYTLTFNEPVKDVEDNITWTPVVGTGTLDSVTEIDSETWEIAFSGVAALDSYTITVGTGQTDICGTPIDAAVDIGLFMCEDPVEGAPAVTSPLSQGYPSGTTSGTYTLTFNENVSGVDIGSLTWTAVSGSGTMDSVTEVDAQTYEVDFSGAADEDQYTITVPVSVIDECGHPLEAEVEIAINIVDCITEFGSDSYYRGCEIDHVFEDITSTGTLALAADDSATTVSIGFTFNFYGTDSTTAYISTNGTVTFGTDYISLANSCLPATSPTSPFLAIMWDDLDCGNGGDGLYYQTLGSAGSRRFIIQWNTERYPSSAQAKFQMVFYEATGDIEYRYLDANFSNVSYDYGANATVGIQQNTSSAIQYSCNTAALDDLFSLMFYRL